MEDEMHIVESEIPKFVAKNYSSPVKFELDIQRQRVIYILHFAIQKMEIMAYLPMMIDEDYKTLKKFLMPDELEFVKYACAKYSLEGPKKLKNLVGAKKYARIVDRIKFCNYQKLQLHQAKGDYHIAQVIEMISSNEKLVKHLRTVPRVLESQIQIIIDYMRHVRDLILNRLLVSSQEQMEKEKKLKRAYNSIGVLNRGLQEIKEQLVDQREKWNQILDEKRAVLDTHKSRLDRLRSQFEFEMMKKVRKSERAMMTEVQARERNQSELQIKYSMVTEAYTKQLAEDLAEEAQLRQKKNKLEARLSSWLNVYDNDMGKKQEEIDKLEEAYQNLQGDYEHLKDDFEFQTTEYDILMKERDEEIKRIFETKMMLFIQNRSARIIQRRWLAHWKQKLERRRRRKLLRAKQGKRTKGQKEKPLKIRKAKAPEMEKVSRTTDVDAKLKETFKKKAHVFEDLDTTKDFPK